jgi:hypothetical protein
MESRLAAPVRARGWGLRGARLQVSADSETHFPLFQPVALGGGQGAALVTLRPNQDIGAALEAAAQEAGMPEAQVFGLGSLVHPRLVGQPPIDSFATEILLREGRISGGKAQLRSDLVTLDGRLLSGVLEPDANGVCITAEVLLVA